MVEVVLGGCEHGVPKGLFCGDCKFEESLDLGEIDYYPEREPLYNGSDENEM